MLEAYAIEKVKMETLRHSLHRLLSQSFHGDRHLVFEAIYCVTPAVQLLDASDYNLALMCREHVKTLRRIEKNCGVKVILCHFQNYFHFF